MWEKRDLPEEEAYSFDHILGSYFPLKFGIDSLVYFLDLSYWSLNFCWAMVIFAHQGIILRKHDEC